MELPHFKLFWRRLLRQSGRGQINIALFWLLASLFTLIPFDDLFPSLGSGVLKLYSIYSIVFIGHFLLYKVIASTMQLAVDVASGGVLGWFCTPLATREALLGTLLATCLLSVVPYTGLCLFQPFAMVALNWYDLPSQLVPGMYDWGQQNLLMIPGLVSFALACVVLQLPFRNSRYRFLLPDAIAVASACILFWEGPYVYESGIPYSLSSAPLSYTIPFAILIAHLLFFIGRRAVMDPSPVMLSILVFSFFLLPVILGTLGGLSSILGPWHMWSKNISFVYSDKLSAVHAAYSIVYPGLRIAWNDGWRVIGNSTWLLGNNVQYAMTILAIVKLMLCIIWWKFAIWQINTTRRGDNANLG